MKTAITAKRALQIVQSVRDILYSVPAPFGIVLDPEKEWSVEMLEYIAEELNDAGLVPEEEAPAVELTLLKGGAQ